jgi:hypothetical protein
MPHETVSESDASAAQTEEAIWGKELSAMSYKAHQQTFCWLVLLSFPDASFRYEASLLWRFAVTRTLDPSIPSQIYAYDHIISLHTHQ